MKKITRAVRRAQHDYRCVALYLATKSKIARDAILQAGVNVRMREDVQ